MVTSIEHMISRWHASVYEKTQDAEGCIQLLETILGDRPLTIFEPGAGTGKIASALSKKHHTVTGMDVDKEMLFYAEKRAKNATRLRLLNADLLVAPWPKDFDAVLIADNLMHNLITDWEYKQAQKQLILKSANSLKKKGLLFLDFDCPLSLAPYGQAEKLVFEGTDEDGFSGKMYIKGMEADEKTRLVKSKRIYFITTPSGEALRTEQITIKHFLTLEETTAWLYRAGFTIEALYGSYKGAPFNEENRRCVILARKE